MKTVGLLSDLKVLDLSRILAAPFATQILGDMGATVFKIEHPALGDDTRTWGPPFTEQGHESAYFLAVNRNKKSLAIDFKTTQGRELILKLAEQCDVVVENFPPETLPRNGLGYADFAKRNPRIVMASISGFGASGPYKNRPSYDVMASATGGLLGITGSEKEPAKVGVAISDVCAGLYAHGAILAALLRRSVEPTGKGCHIDVSLLDTQIASLVNVASSYLVAGKEPKRWGTAHASIVPYRVFEAADGEMLVIGALNDVQWIRLCKVLEFADSVRDEYATNPLRVANRLVIDSMIENVIVAKSVAHWTRVLEKGRVPYGPVNNLKQVFEDPHIQDRHMVQQVNHPSCGPVTLLSPPVRFDGAQCEIRLPPPTLGQHTVEVLQQELGLTMMEIDYLRAIDAIR